MSLDKSKLYMVYNNSSSKVIVHTRHDSLIFEGSHDGEPVGRPLAFDEIAVINANSNVFKIGLLWFESDIAEEMYEELRIRDWKDILTDGQIRDMILHPTAEKLTRLLQIKNRRYFERVRAIYTSLHNKGYDISNKVDQLIRSRYVELCRNILETQLEVVSKDDIPVADPRVAELEKELQEMKELLKSMVQANKDVTVEEAAPEVAEAEPKESAPVKKAAPKTKSTEKRSRTTKES